ncbi:DUF664 domain-containing protein [Streptomyces avidinii]|uniref:mycothiol transferase n=1 Tax=Streptomyces avidinii TaxID=1895 RepID=UPI003867B0FA
MLITRLPRGRAALPRPRPRPTSGVLVAFVLGVEVVEDAPPAGCRWEPLPSTPWSPSETVYRSARRILLHLIRETARHAGHVDIIRESLDGASTTAQR